jgi:hypothetical protein
VTNDSYCLPLPGIHQLSTEAMTLILPGRLYESALQRRYWAALRRVRIFGTMDLPEDFKPAAIARVMRRFEEQLDRVTQFRLSALGRMLTPKHLRVFIIPSCPLRSSQSVLTGQSAIPG